MSLQEKLKIADERVAVALVIAEPRSGRADLVHVNAVHTLL
jgi:hypothetical protein